MKAKSRDYKKRLYGALMWVEPPISKFYVNLRERMVKQIDRCIRNLYMKNIITIELSNDVNRYTSDYEGDIVRESLRILRYNDGKQFSFKVLTNDIIMYCTLESLDGAMDSVSSPRVAITTIAYGPDMMVARTFFGYDSPNYALTNVSGPVVLSKNSKDSEDFINETMEGSFIFSKSFGDEFPIIDTDAKFIEYLRLVIKSMRRCFNDESKQLSHEPSHSPMEMYTIKELYKSDLRPCRVPLPGIFEWSWKGSIQENDSYDIIQKGKITPSLHTDENPLVDLSERSFNSIIKYVKKNGYMFPEDYDGLKKNVNMVKCISGSRYGSSFIYPLQINGDTVNSQLTFAVHNNNGCLMLDIPCGDVYFILTVLFDNMDEFNLYSNIITIELSGTVMNYDLLPCNADQGNRMVPMEFRDLENIVRLIHRICALFITIFERPRRTRVICERRPRTVSEGTLSDEKDYVIRRIMKSSSEAKTYITRMSGQYKDRDYTMEQWYRVGHTRQLKDGRIVYVSECECHRRLPLSDKKIHLQL